jgi:hypothetical protein
MHVAGDSVYPSYMLGNVTSVHPETHSIDVQLYGYIELLEKVPLFRTPGTVNLPHKEDMVIVIFDRRHKPLAIGWYPKFIRDDISISKVYQLQEGELLLHSDYGGRLMMLKSGIMRFSNWVDQGIEIDGASGSYIERSPSKKDIFAGVVERHGYIRRAGVVTLGGTPSIFEMDNLESLLKKVGTISATGAITTLNDPGSIELYEKRIEVKVPGSATTAAPNGINIFEDTVGTAVISNNSVAGVYQETLSSPPVTANTPTPNPLRRKTVYYDSAGVTPLVTEEVDCFGNINISISALATNGVNLTTPFLALNVRSAALTPTMIPPTSMGNIVTNNPVNADPITGIPLQGILQLAVNTAL